MPGRCQEAAWLCAAVEGDFILGRHLQDRLDESIPWVFYHRVLTKSDKAAMPPHDGLVHFIKEMFARQGVRAARPLSEGGQGLPVHAGSNLSSSNSMNTQLLGKINIFSSCHCLDCPISGRILQMYTNAACPPPQNPPKKNTIRTLTG